MLVSDDFVNLISIFLAGIEFALNLMSVYKYFIKGKLLYLLEYVIPSFNLEITS